MSTIIYNKRCFKFALNKLIVPGFEKHFLKNVKLNYFVKNINKCRGKYSELAF